MKKVFVVVNGEGRIYGVYSCGNAAMEARIEADNDAEFRGSRMLFSIQPMNLTE